MFESTARILGEEIKVDSKTVNMQSLHDYQGKSKKLLFVCTAGLLRSPTAMNVAIFKGYNARCCGSHPEYALIPISEKLIKWSDKIIFVNHENYWKSRDTFENDEMLTKLLQEKSIIWNIHDNYDFMDKELLESIEWMLGAEGL